MGRGFAELERGTPEWEKLLGRGLRFSCLLLCSSPLSLFCRIPSYDLEAILAASRDSSELDVDEVLRLSKASALDGEGGRGALRKGRSLLACFS